MVIFYPLMVNRMVELKKLTLYFGGCDGVSLQDKRSDLGRYKHPIQHNVTMIRICFSTEPLLILAHLK